MCFFAGFLLAFQTMCVILYNITQTYGVTVAQVILVHFVEVRILVGLPFFFASSTVYDKNSYLFCA